MTEMSRDQPRLLAALEKASTAITKVRCPVTEVYKSNWTAPSAAFESFYCMFLFLLFIVLNFK